MKEVKDPNAAKGGKTFPNPFGLDRHHMRMKVWSELRAGTVGSSCRNHLMLRNLGCSCVLAGVKSVHAASGVTQSLWQQ